MFSETGRYRIDLHDKLNPLIEPPTLVGTISVKIFETSQKTMTETPAQLANHRRPLAVEVQFNPDNPSSQWSEVKLANTSSDDDLPREKPAAPVSRASRNLHFVPSHPLQAVSTVHDQLRQQFSGDVKVIGFCENLKELSPRELDVLLLTVKGFSCKEVAARINVGIATAAKHRASMFKKLSVRNSTELVYLLDAVLSYLSEQRRQGAVDNRSEQPIQNLF